MRPHDCAGGADNPEAVARRLVETVFGGARAGGEGAVRRFPALRRTRLPSRGTDHLFEQRADEPSASSVYDLGGVCMKRTIRYAAMAVAILSPLAAAAQSSAGAPAAPTIEQSLE